MRKHYKGDKVLFERGRWLIIEESRPANFDCNLWLVHLCRAQDIRFHSHYHTIAEYHPDLTPVCQWCMTKVPKPVQTVFQLLSTGY